ncbi:transcription initiation factor TFIID subunit 1 [Harpegnathos saltator]|nr:transcription initiation factor TFIID subunit 1 [Harpegnathos saltator]XP_025154352.1 transcription initiation factor TFIID subunit 1 [Harpegnathos saltator]
MLKSRSSGDNRSNSVEAEEQQRQPIDRSSLPSDADEYEYDADTAETKAEDKNCLSVRNEQTIPSSPPPSYEHVLEETRMGSSTVALRREAKEGSRENEKSTGDAEGGDAGDDGGGGPGGGGGGGDRRAAKGPKILHKSSKEFYKAMAKQWGITCKMSDHCRCLDCQSHYFDCDYEKDEQVKGDGGLSAGTPMFISEVMHGSACALL